MAQFSVKIISLNGAVLDENQHLVIEDSPIGAAAGHSAGMRVIFHPQLPHADPASIAPGAHYLAPDGALGALIAHAMTTGELK